MTLVETVTVGSGGVTAITFNSIPQTATDLMVVISMRVFTGAVQNTLPIKFNGSTTGFTARELTGNGSSAFSQTSTNYVYSVNGNGATANTFSNSQIYIPNYAGATNKSFSVDTVVDNNGTEGRLQIFAGLWSNTSAITSITLDGDGVTIMQYSTASLYTIKNGSGGATVS